MPASAGGSRLRFLPEPELLSLAPISVDVDPATTARDPAAGDPDCARPRWRRPASRNPDISSSGPAVISGYPYPTRMQSTSRTFNNHRGRGPDANNYLRVGHTHTQRDPAYRDEQAFLQRHQKPPPCDNSLYEIAAVANVAAEKDDFAVYVSKKSGAAPRELCACPRLRGAAGL
jgi:hypothetical protein